MVMTSCATQGQAHQRAADRVNLLVDNVHLHFHRIIFGKHFRPQRKKTRGRPGLDTFLLDVIEQICRDLFANKAIEGFVPVEGGNDVVTIMICVGVSQVFVEPVGVGVTSHV